MTKRPFLVLLLFSILSTGVFIAASHILERVGFPLDDAWIYQAYARNLAQYGEWAFIHGAPSAGSTGPLWAALLAPGFVVGLSPLAWSFALGIVTLAGIGELSRRISLFSGEQRPILALLVGLGVLLDWHLIWAAVSGMETLLFTAGVLAAIWMLFRLEGASGWKGWLLAGLLVGTLVWVRPEGLTLSGPFVVFVLIQDKSSRKKAVSAAAFFGGLSAVFGPYLLFNRWLAGAWWPNTFFAKQAEYAIVVQQAPLLQRLLAQFSQPLIGVGLALIPGFVAALIWAVRGRRWPVVLSMVWMAGHFSLYALRLPVTYQHGRYAIPGIAVFCLWGWLGSLRLLFTAWEQAQRRMWAFAGGTLLSLLTIGFAGLGANAYAQDVAIINTEMVAAANWIEMELPEDALIAAHDIGALGYFAGREVVDLAGLVLPDVVAFIRDEAQLGVYLDQVGADYLMTFPDWYSDLPKSAELIYQTGGEFSSLAGGANMAVYRWIGGD